MLQASARREGCEEVGLICFEWSRSHVPPPLKRLRCLASTTLTPVRPVLKGPITLLGGLKRRHARVSSWAAPAMRWSRKSQHSTCNTSPPLTKHKRRLERACCREKRLCRTSTSLVRRYTRCQGVALSRPLLLHITPTCLPVWHPPLVDSLE